MMNADEFVSFVRRHQREKVRGSMTVAPSGGTVVPEFVWAMSSPYERIKILYDELDIACDSWKVVKEAIAEELVEVVVGALVLPFEDSFGLFVVSWLEKIESAFVQHCIVTQEFQDGSIKDDESSPLLIVVASDRDDHRVRGIASAFHRLEVVDNSAPARARPVSRRQVQLFLTAW